MLTDKGILYIEPRGNTSPEPIIDELTMLMAGALRLGVMGTGIGNFRPGSRYRGVHWCRCGAMSANCEFQLPNGEVTNSLATHYLAWHRVEIAEEQLEKVRVLADVATPVQPSEQELCLPGR